MTRTRQTLALLFLANATALPAMSDGRIEKVVANQAPETIITAGPDDGMGTTYRVRFSWSGTDLDGNIDHFDFIMVDHPASNDSIGPGTADP